MHLMLILHVIYNFDSHLCSNFVNEIPSDGESGVLILLFNHECVMFNVIRVADICKICDNDIV